MMEVLGHLYQDNRNKEHTSFISFWRRTTVASRINSRTERESTANRAETVGNKAKGNGGRKGGACVWGRGGQSRRSAE